jgi:predicted XRE-type DNA-binding protein
VSVWDDIADSPEEAENLKVRAALIRAIRARVNEIGWSQTTAAQNLGLTQPRLSDLSRGMISKFSLHALVDIASKLGIHAGVEVDTDFALPA